MADDSLPKDYDAIVLGTGMTECIIAAALSRIGQRVLHLDRNDYYSGDWGTFHFEAIERWIAKQQGREKESMTIKPPKEGSLEDGEESIPLKVESTTVTNVTENVYIPEELPAREETTPLEQRTDNSKSDEEVDGDSPMTEASKPECTPNVEDVEMKENPDGDEKPESESETMKIEEEPKQEETKRKEWSFGEMKKKWRKFNIDLQPKILYCRGPMVELLISSDIAKYCEFKSITRVLTLLNGDLQRVPCSRSDVFSSKAVSMIEKRMLMKLLTFCLEFDKHPEEYEAYEDKTFDEFLQSRKLSANIRHYVKYAIAMATAKTTTLEGLKSTQKFLTSLGRYGNTAFLWPLYGSGEMPQCFCRMCAVFGGIYCLRRTGVSLVVDKDKKCKGIIDTEGERLNAKWVIIESSYTTGDMVPKEKPKSISRAVFVVDRSLQSSDSEDISLLSFPHPEDEGTVINVIELSPGSMACPKDTHMVHMTCQGVNGPEKDFASAIQTLFQPTDPGKEDETRPKVLWSLMFSQEDTNGLPLNDHGLDGVFVIATPDAELDFDHSIKEARDIFKKLCPGEEFLPRAPNPEDIIYDDDQQGPNAEGSGFEPGKEGKGEKEEGETVASDSKPELSQGSDGQSKTEKGTSSNEPVPQASDENPVSESKGVEMCDSNQDQPEPSNGKE